MHGDTLTFDCPVDQSVLALTFDKEKSVAKNIAIARNDTKMSTHSIAPYRSLCLFYQLFTGTTYLRLSGGSRRSTERSRLFMKLTEQDRPAKCRRALLSPL